MPHRHHHQVGIVGGGPAGLMLSHLLAPRRHRLGRRSTSAPDARSRRPHRAGHPRARQRPAAGRLRCLRPGAARRATSTSGIELRFGGASHRIDFRDAGRRLGVALPADRRVHRPGRRARAATAATSGSASADVSVDDLTTDRPAMRFTDADGERPRGPRRGSWWAPTGRAACAASSSRRRSASAVLPRVPVRLVRHPLRGAAERARADLQPLRARLRADQPAHRRRCSGCTSSATPTRTSTTGPTTGSGSELQARVRRRTASPCRRGRSPRRPVLPFRSLRAASRCATATCCWPATPPTPCRPTGAKGLNLALADVRGAGRGPRAAPARRDDGRARRLRAAGAARGCGRRSTSPTG